MNASAPEQGSLKTRAMYGAVWTALQLGGSQLIRLAGNLALTKLLFPEAFGVMSIVGLMMTALALFSDIGLHECIIKSEREDRAFLGTAMSLQAIRGFVMGAGAWALATPVAAYYDTPEISEIGPLFALSAVTRGFASPNVHVAGRHMQLRPVMMIQLSSQLLAMLAMIGLSTVYRSVWPLVIGGVVDALLYATATHTLLPGKRIWFRMEPAARSEFFGYGRFLMLSSALTFVANSTGRLVFGKMLGMAVLGVYGVAHALAMAPTMALGAIGEKIIFPVYCRILQRGDPLRGIFDQARRPLVVGAGWALSMVIGGGHAIVDLLYDDRYIEAGWMLQWLGVGSWFTILSGTHSAALKASGKMVWHAGGTAAQTATLLGLLSLGLQRWGIAGGIGVLVAADVARFLVVALSTASAKLGRIRSDVGFSALLGLASGVSYWVIQRSGVAPLPQLFIVLFIGTALWSPFLIQMARLAREPSTQ